MRGDFAVIGVTEMSATLKAFAFRAGSVSAVAFPLIVQDFWNMEAERFDANGPGWAPLSQTTIEIKRAKGYDDPSRPLVATGALMASLTGMTEHTVVEIHPETLFVGTDLPYAIYHQQGPRQIRVFGGASATLPERKIVELSLDDAIRWTGIIQSALGRVGRAA